MRCLEKASQMAADKRFEERVACSHKWTVKEGKCLPDRETPTHAAKDRSKEMISCSKSLGQGLGVGSEGEFILDSKIENYGSNKR